MAAEAKNFLNSPFIAKALEEYKDRLFTEWQNKTSTADREQLWHKLQAMEDFKKFLNGYINRATVDKYNKKQEE